MTKNGQFIYLRTRGRLDVDSNSRAVTSFVCTNTVVDEIEGKHLIKLMKEKFNLIVNNNDDIQAIDNGDTEVILRNNSKKALKIYTRLNDGSEAHQITGRMCC